MRYYTVIELNTRGLVDGRTGRYLAMTSHWSMPGESGAQMLARHDRFTKVCDRLNTRDLARRRQFGEPRSDFAARRGLI